MESFSASVRISEAFLALRPLPFTGQGIGEQSAEAGAGAGDENHLLGIHDYPSLWRYRKISLMPEVKRVATKINTAD
jgi:hypothetical protein